MIATVVNRPGLPICRTGFDVLVDRRFGGRVSDDEAVGFITGLATVAAIVVADRDLVHAPLTADPDDDYLAGAALATDARRDSPDQPHHRPGVGGTIDDVLAGYLPLRIRRRFRAVSPRRRPWAAASQRWCGIHGAGGGCVRTGPGALQPARWFLPEGAARGARLRAGVGHPDWLVGDSGVAGGTSEVFVPCTRYRRRAS